MPSFLLGICLFRFHLIPADAEEAMVKLIQFFNNGLLLFGAGPATAKARDRRHQLVDVGTGGLALPNPEGVLQKLASLWFPEFFFLDQLLQGLFLLGADITGSFGHHIIHIVDARNKVFNQLLFAVQFRAGVHGATNGDVHFYVVAVGVMVFLHLAIYD